MDHLRSGHHRSSIDIATLDNECTEGIAQCNLVELTSSWKRQNHVYVHFKSVTGASRNKHLNVKQNKVENKPRRSFFTILKSIL